MRHFFKYALALVHNILQKDPAAKHWLEVCLCYPGFHALVLHYIAHLFWQLAKSSQYLALFYHFIARFLASTNRFITGIEIHPAAMIGQRVFIDHGMGVVIGETAIIGDDCTLYQGVTLGGTSLAKGEKRHPTLGKGVIVSAGAKVLGNFMVGDYAKIGANAVVLKPVPAYATAIGIPAKIIEKNAADAQNTPQETFSAYGIKSMQDVTD